MKKLLLLFAIPISVLAHQHTWYQPGSYPDFGNYPKSFGHEIKGAPNYYKFESNLKKDKDVLDEFKNNDKAPKINKEPTQTDLMIDEAGKQISFKFKTI